MFAYDMDEAGCNIILIEREIGLTLISSCSNGKADYYEEFILLYPINSSYHTKLKSQWQILSPWRIQSELCILDGKVIDSKGNILKEEKDFTSQRFTHEKVLYLANIFCHQQVSIEEFLRIFSNNFSFNPDFGLNLSINPDLKDEEIYQTLWNCIYNIRNEDFIRQWIGDMLGAYADSEHERHRAFDFAEAYFAGRMVSYLQLIKLYGDEMNSGRINEIYKQLERKARSFFISSLQQEYKRLCAQKKSEEDE